MFLKRKGYEVLVEWKSKKNKKAILIEGLRQIGKSTLCEKFAKENYKNVYLFDFRSSEAQRNIFSGDFDLKSFKEDLFTIFQREYSDENAVLVFDEIGDCANARAAIKYLLKETRFDIIATGSLLGVSGFSSRKNRSPSVGFSHFYTMHSLDFEEFLWANGVSGALITKINDCLESFMPLEDKYHVFFQKLYKHYVLTGGMPEAVMEYLESHDFAAVLETNADKLKEMRGDFGRTINEKGEVTIDDALLLRTEEVYRVLAPQLAKDNAKFQFSFIRKGARSKEYEQAITWLEDYGLVIKCHNVTDLGLPLEGYKNMNAYKLYFGDIGLFIAKLGPETASLILRGGMDSYGGYIYEGIAADAIHKANHGLYYFDNGKSELDFLVQDDNKLAVLAVKMNGGKPKSARAIMQGLSSHHADRCYKVSNKNFSTGDYYLGLPHYALPFLLQRMKEQLNASLVVDPVE